VVAGAAGEAETALSPRLVDLARPGDHDQRTRAVKASKMAQQYSMPKRISAGPAHALPPDLRKALLKDAAALAAWEDITPLARNEWICWTISVKKQETRDEHIGRMREQLKEGKRRPCCWPGCQHR
jgi:uncharacterized protein YdeI (YjbR/CyaY-like superfamily)